MMPMICCMQKERAVGFMGVELRIRTRTEQDVHYPVRLHRIWQKDMDWKKLWSVQKNIFPEHLQQCWIWEPAADRWIMGLISVENSPHRVICRDIVGARSTE